nr:MAG TPA: hypothetical protein [Caudoviricetes sp.]
MIDLIYIMLIAALFYGVLQATLFFVYSLVTKNKMP